MCCLLFLASALLWSRSERLTNVSVYPLSHWLSHAVALFVGIFDIFLTLSLGLALHFQCVCSAVMSRSPGTERFMVNTLQKAEPGRSGVLFLLNKSCEWLQASGLHSYQLAFSFVLVTWYFMALSLVFTETTRPYSFVFMGFHWSFSRCVGFPLESFLRGSNSKLLISELFCVAHLSKCL